MIGLLRKPGVSSELALAGSILQACASVTQLYNYEVRWGSHSGSYDNNRLQRRDTL
jgi:hypothetical protein